jgi:hypothetical protein
MMKSRRDPKPSARRPDAGKAGPVRLHLSRRGGFNLQRQSRRTNGLDAVNVARPGKWGNPFTVEDYGREKAIALYRTHLKRSRLDIVELRGRNLACWCAADELCHADVLLALANA